MNTAPVKWAQRKDSLYVTITLPDVKNHKVELTENKLSFAGSSNGKDYALELVFFKEISPEGSIWNVLPSSVQMKLNKKDAEADFWPRLLADKHLEKTNVTVDWDRYVDEDEAEGADFDTQNLDGGMDFGGMGGMGGMDLASMMGGMGGMGGMDLGSMMGGMQGLQGMGEEDEGDSDDDEQLPDLETTDA